MSISVAAMDGDVGEVERLLGQDPGLLNARDVLGMTPLIWASVKNRIDVVRLLVTRGAALDEPSLQGYTALLLASGCGNTPVVRLLVERGADPAIATPGGVTPLMVASCNGRLEVVRLLLGHPRAKATIDFRDCHGETALRAACYKGHAGVVMALLEGGADPTIADADGVTPMAIAKQHPDDDDEEEKDEHDPVSAEGRRECVAALEVIRLCLVFLLSSCLRHSFSRSAT
jgi:ankyrin repeat protein